MYYAIMSEDVEDSLEKRKSARSAHLERLNQLVEQHRLLLAGPHPATDNDKQEHNGFSGSLVIAEFDSLDQAQIWADADPYMTAGVYQQVMVKPFKKVLSGITN